MLRVKRLELIRLWQQILNLPRLPFRHTRKVTKLVTHWGFEPQAP